MTGLSSLPSLVRVLSERAARAPDGRAFTILTAGEPDLDVTNAQLWADARRQSAALEEAGVGEGELVVVAGEHGYPVLAGFCGALVRGAVPTVAPYVSDRASADATEGRVQQLVERADARAVLTLSGLVAPFAERLADSPCAVLALPEGVGDGPADGPVTERGGDDDAYVQFSSGTTSDPKGAVLSHRAVLAYVRSIEESGGMGPDDVFVGWAPLFHDLGLLTCFLLPLCTGARGVLMAPAAWMRRPGTLLQAVHDHGGTATWMPNFAFARTRGAVRDGDLAGLDLSGWRFVGCGGEPIVASDLHAFADWLAPTGFRPEALVAGYGMAESVLGAAHGRRDGPLEADRVSGPALRERRAEPVGPDAPDAVAVTSCGPPAPGMAVRVVGDDGRPLGEREVGEIALRGDFLLSRYWRRPDLTERALRDGWFHTGDVGYLADGELHVCDRKGDLVIVGGKNVYPDHVEAAVRGALGPAAKFAAAFGLADARLGTERLVVVVEPKGRPDEAEQEALAATVRQSVRDAVDVAPADVRLVDRGAIVRTTSGKVSRAATRAAYVAAGYAPEPAPAAAGALPAPAALAAELRGLARAHLGFEPAPDANLFEAGADSIRVMELVLTAAERYGRDLPTDALMALPTLDRIAAALAGDGADAAPDVPADVLQAVAEAPGLPPRVRAGGNRWIPTARRVLRLPNGRQRLWALCGSRSVQAGPFRNEARRVREALAVVPSAQPPAAVVQQSLFTNVVRLFDLANEEGSGGLFDRVETHGAEHLDAALAGPAGTLLVTSHSAGRQGLTAALAARGAFDREGVVSRGRVTRPFGWTPAQVAAARRAEGWAAFEHRQLAGQLGASLDRLRAGGVVVIAGDGPFGASGREVAFFGRRRWFGLGFAELAERTGATVLTTFDVLTPDGTLHVHVAPLARPEGGTHDARVAAWLRAYADQLEAWWTAHLGSVRWGQLAELAGAPPVEVPA